MLRPTDSKHATSGAYTTDMDKRSLRCHRESEIAAVALVTPLIRSVTDDMNVQGGVINDHRGGIVFKEVFDELREQSAASTRLCPRR